MKKWQIFLLAVIVVSFIVLKLFDYFYWPKGDVKIGDNVTKVLIADKPSHWHKGWSDRSSMGSVQGMWFQFGTKSYHTMVMRDMKFALDIIWIADGKIVDIAPFAKPEPTLAESELTKYRPRLPATEVLELRAGFASENRLKIGDEVVLRRY